MERYSSLWQSKSAFPSRDFRSCDYKGSWQKQFLNGYIDEGFLNGFPKATEKYANYKDEHLPEHLYKFFPVTTYSLIGLQNQSLFLSTPGNFNDTFDSYTGVAEYTYIKTYMLQELKKRHLIAADSTQDHLSKEEYLRLSCSNSEDLVRHLGAGRRTFFNEWHDIKEAKSKKLQMIFYDLLAEGRTECNQKIHAIRTAPVRVACFSNFGDDEELTKNTTMWSHYADNHKGFCIQYSLNFLDSPIKNVLKCGLYKVIYSAKISKASPRELIKLGFDGDNELKINSLLAKTIYRALITKSRFWNYENEWRLIIGKHDFGILKGDSISFPFINAIYLGCHIEDVVKRHIAEFAFANNISVYQARKNSERFELDLIPFTSEDLERDEGFP